MIKIPKAVELLTPLDELQDLALGVVEVASQTAVASMKERVRQGLGVNDAEMKSKAKVKDRHGAYSQQYADERRKKRRRVKTRDLTFTGKMLKGVVVDRLQKTETGAEAVVTVTNDQKEKAAFNQAQTPWFGLSPSDESEVMAAAEAELQRLMSQK